MTTIHTLFLTFLLAIHGALAIGQGNTVELPGPVPNHPRILLLTGDEQSLRQRIESDKAWGNLHAAILTECDVLLPIAPVERIQVGKRLLDKSREALRCPTPGARPASRSI